jgi:regulator of replication initiation timing
MSEIGERDKLLDAIRTMKTQLEDLRTDRTDKSQSSFSILNETLGQAEQLRLENEDMKRRVKIYEESLTQKRGAVEIDIILKEKNNLELQAEGKKRE